MLLCNLSHVGRTVLQILGLSHAMAICLHDRSASVRASWNPPAFKLAVKWSSRCFCGTLLQCE